MEKNVTVTDEAGNTYENTYIKRAKGLVKKGRARFTDESHNRICLLDAMRTDNDSPARYEINDLTEGTKDMADQIINNENDIDVAMSLDSAKVVSLDDNIQPVSSETEKMTMRSALFQLLKTGIETLLNSDFEEEALDAIKDIEYEGSENTVQMKISAIEKLIDAEKSKTESKIEFMGNMLDRLGFDRKADSKLEVLRLKSRSAISVMSTANTDIIKMDIPMEEKKALIEKSQSSCLEAIGNIEF